MMFNNEWNAQETVPEHAACRRFKESEMRSPTRGLKIVYTFAREAGLSK